MEHSASVQDFTGLHKHRRDVLGKWQSRAGVTRPIVDVKCSLVGRLLSDYESLETLHRQTHNSSAVYRQHFSVYKGRLRQITQFRRINGKWRHLAELLYKVHLSISWLDFIPDERKRARDVGLARECARWDIWTFSQTIAKSVCPRIYLVYS